MCWWFKKKMFFLLPRKSNAKFLPPSLKTLTNFKSPYSNLFKELVAVCRDLPVSVKLAVILKIVP
jgi:hypothetical protein